MLDAAEDFIWRNGRALEQRRFEFHFRAGQATPLRAAVIAHQNLDGGFGHALEPDGRGPTSQPLHALVALRVLDEIGMGDSATVLDLCDFLATVTGRDGGLPHVLPTMRGYPHAQWWRVVECPSGHILPTGPIAGLLHKNLVEHPWLGPATDFCWAWIGQLTTAHPYEISACVGFLDHVPDRQRAVAEAQRLGLIVREQRLVDLADGSASSLPPGYAGGQLHKPHDYAPQPTSLARHWFTDAEIEQGLTSLVAGQQADGGWMLPWPVWTPVAQFEWRPIVTIEALLTLRAYGRLNPRTGFPTPPGHRD
ncbi:hypothetical protein [Goodfellowiella coeruleoviolacea]|uniref:Prenyltransferase n=1 Tax=Goodfellowiella coeruleoviolacea TaxID=334858 RepID=A0AAE3KFH6_9PSEU|nr:hypothetical protein [Goodfellowiella coeruleoviolacea]MCP2164992.1 hypothetical protein [Goodfellowiella coeruleoviolacea]